MAARTDAAGRCTDCERVSVVYETGGDWRVLGTGGDCQCGNDEFTILSDGE